VRGFTKFQKKKKRLASIYCAAVQRFSKLAGKSRSELLLQSQFLKLMKPMRSTDSLTHSLTYLQYDLKRLFDLEEENKLSTSFPSLSSSSVVRSSKNSSSLDGEFSRCLFLNVPVEVTLVTTIAPKLSYSRKMFLFKS